MDSEESRKAKLTYNKGMKMLEEQKNRKGRGIREERGKYRMKEKEEEERAMGA